MALALNDEDNMHTISALTVQLDIATTALRRANVEKQRMVIAMENLVEVIAKQQREIISLKQSNSVQGDSEDDEKDDNKAKDVNTPSGPNANDDAILTIGNDSNTKDQYEDFDGYDQQINRNETAGSGIDANVKADEFIVKDDEEYDGGDVTIPKDNNNESEENKVPDDVDVDNINVKTTSNDEQKFEDNNNNVETEQFEYYYDNDDNEYHEEPEDEPEVIDGKRSTLYGNDDEEENNPNINA